MKFKTFSKSAVLLTASLAVLAACGSKNTASRKENIEVYDSQFTVSS